MKPFGCFWTAVFLSAALAAGEGETASPSPREIRGADGAPMVLVPKGEFIMGSPQGTYIFGDNETPQRRVHLEAFYIDKFEVTNARFRKILTPSQGYMGTFNRDDQPVVGVSWFQANAYCTRVGKRLPTEAEWEKAARGTDGRSYPWGNQPASCDLAVMGGPIPSCSRGYATWEVGSRPLGASPYGAMDMAGNVTEWVADRYSHVYYRNAPAKNPRETLGGRDARVARRGVVQQLGDDSRRFSHRFRTRKIPPGRRLPLRQNRRAGVCRSAGRAAPPNGGEGEKKTFFRFPGERARSPSLTRFPGSCPSQFH
jgi:formylglycine-generating enzyme required for sulfatase activity